MIHVYIFDRECVASNYGIGVYIAQIARSFNQTKNVTVNIIKLYSEEAEYKMTYTGLFYLHEIPRIAQNADVYEKLCWYLLKANVSFGQKNVICHFNYVDDLCLAQLIKNEYPNIQIVLTVHYQQWCFALDGNLDYFIENILKKNPEDLPVIDRNIYKSFLREKLFYDCADCVICLSEFTKNVIEKYYHVNEDKIVVLKNFVSDEYIRLSGARRILLRNKYMFGSEEKLILFVGRLNRIKGINFLIESFKKILEEIANCRLLIVGDGDFQTCLKLGDKVWSKMIFFGYLERDELFDIYQISDIGVLPSMHEQCSYTAIEMMMFGLPFITTDTTGLNEMAVSNELKVKLHYSNRNAYVSSDSLASKIIHLLNSENEGILFDKSRNSYLKYYAENNSIKMELLYKSLFINN